MLIVQKKQIALPRHRRIRGAMYAGTPFFRPLYSPVMAACCAPSPPSCAGCLGGGTSPITVKVVLSGITLCSSCLTVNFASSQSFNITHQGTINGTYCCDYDAASSASNVCGYKAILSDPMTANGYTSFDCSGAVNETLVVDTLRVRFGGSGFGLFTLSITVGGLGSSGAGNNDYYNFYYVPFPGPNPNCVNGTYSATYSSCVESGFVRNFGYGGAATITINGC